MAIEKNIMRSREFNRERSPVEREFEERVIEVNRVSRVAKGGRRIRFRALVVIGNHKGKVGMGIGKANEVADAVRKATSKAKKKLITVPIINGTIPHEILVKHGGSRVLFRPAAPGTSIVAGGSIRSVSELAGITDMLAKSLGSANKVNNVIATLKAFQSFNKNIVEKLRKFDSKLIEAKEVKVEKKQETLPAEKPAVEIVPAEQAIVKKEDTPSAEGGASISAKLSVSAGPSPDGSPDEGAPASETMQGKTPATTKELKPKARKTKKTKKEEENKKIV